MSQELIERIEKFRERGCDTETHVLLCDCRDELTKQAEYKRKAEIWDYLYEAIEHTSRLSDELPDGTAGSSKEDIVNASLDVWREQQKKILALEGHIAKQAERIEKLRTRLSAQTHQTQITAQQIHDAVLAAIKRGTTFPDGIDDQGHPIEQLVGMIVTTLQLKLDEQAERVKALEGLGSEIVEINTANGWNVTTPGTWTDANVYRIPAILGLIHSEVSEALEAFRKNNKENFAEEMADVLIRVLDCTHGLGIDMDKSVRDKLEKNRKRGFRHGGKTV